MILQSLMQHDATIFRNRRISYHNVDTAKSTVLSASTIELSNFSMFNDSFGLTEPGRHAELFLRHEVLSIEDEFVRARQRC